MLLAPLALVLAVIAIPIVLMYVLKLRRQEHLVPSTVLWHQVLEDVQANAPWQRLRFNILLLLQLLALAALILSLARPAYTRSHVIAGDVVVIVDESYGMQARDVLPSRFDAAIARARTLATELAGGNVMSIVGMSAHPHLAIASSGDQGALDGALDTLHASVDQPNFLEALSLAVSLSRAGQTTRAVVLTSRDSGIQSLPLQVPFPVDIERVGGRLKDLGITAFNASSETSGVAAVARVSNFGSLSVRSDLELRIDGRLADVRPLTIAAHQAQNLFWNGLPASARQLQVRLTHADHVSTDKSAWAAVSAESPRRVLLVSRGDYFLEAALADDPTVQLSTLVPTAYVPGMERGFDLVVFDGVLPSTFPATSTLLVAPPAGQIGPIRFSVNRPAGSVEAAGAVTGSATSVLKYVDLSDVHVAQARVVTLPGWLQPLARTAGNTALAAGDHGDIRVALVNFDLQHSDWPLRISFPVVLQNLLAYLAPGLTLGAINVTTGQAVRLFPPSGTRALEIRRPDGTTERLDPPFPPFTHTAVAGLYAVTTVPATNANHRSTRPPSSASFAVNFFPARPAPASGPAILHLGQAQHGTALTASVPVSIVWIVELVALGLLGVEWWVAFRGTRIL